MPVTVIANLRRDMPSGLHHVAFGAEWVKVGVLRAHAVPGLLLPLLESVRDSLSQHGIHVGRGQHAEQRHGPYGGCDRVVGGSAQSGLTLAVVRVVASPGLRVTRASHLVHDALEELGAASASCSLFNIHDYMLATSDHRSHCGTGSNDAERGPKRRAQYRDDAETRERSRGRASGQ